MISGLVAIRATPAPLDRDRFTRKHSSFWSRASAFLHLQHHLCVGGVCVEFLLGSWVVVVHTFDVMVETIDRRRGFGRR
jgi:hypothetical protein